MKKILSYMLVSAMLILSLGTTVFAASQGEIVIIYTNDTHCEVDADFGFADVSAIKADEEAKGNEVVIIDSGDAVQGGAIGSLSKGEYIIEIMNEIGYNVAAPGNHEFDYGIERLKELSVLADFPYVCANFVSLEDNKTLFEPYHIVEVGGIEIAFIGITTPNTFTSTAPTYFQNEAGEYIYDFSGDSFYECVQKNIDNAEGDGADMIIALAHLGVEDADLPYTSKEIIANTEGFDAVIDAHSHSVIAGDTYKNKNNEDVVLTSTGSKFANIGTMRIDKTGEIEIELLNKDYKADGLSSKAQAAYDKSNAFIDATKAKYEAELEKLIAVAEYDLTINDPDKFDPEKGAYRRVRRGETNMGNFCADAYRAVLGCDVAIINGGGVRASIEKGDVSYGDVLNVNPFGNDLCIIEVTGTQILNALEHGAILYPEENGAFLQVSGLSYEIDAEVKSPVVLDDKGMFIEVSGERRVKNVKVAGEPISEDAIYTLGGSAYTLINGGDGYTMFKGAKVINASACSDCDALMQYVSEDLNGVIGEEYANPHGSGRIKEFEKQTAEKVEFADTIKHWAKESIDEAVAAGMVTGVTKDSFAPDEKITRAMLVTILHRMEGLPEAEKASFDDVADGEYYSKAVWWANKNAIMNGIGDGKFAPDANITREEMAAAITRYCAYKGKMPSSEGATQIDYTDLKNVSEWALAPIIFVKLNNIMTGNEDNSFKPSEGATRAEAIVTLLRANKLIATK